MAGAGFLGLEPLTVSLLLMTATTPLVLLAARILHRYCEAPCVAIARRVGHGRQPERTFDEPSAVRAGFDGRRARPDRPSAAASASP